MLIINQNEKFSVKFKRTPKVNVTESGCFHQNAKSLMWMAPELIKSKYNNRFVGYVPIIFGIFR